MKKTKITVGDLVDLIDYNRENDTIIQISERDDEWNTLRTDSMILDRISDAVIDSISAENDMIQIWLTDDTVEEYWQSMREQNKV